MLKTAVAGIAGAVFLVIAPDAVAVVFICTLEGAVMMSKLYGGQSAMRLAVRHLESYLDSILV